jgi:hypothetical protein
MKLASLPVMIALGSVWIALPCADAQNRPATKNVDWVDSTPARILAAGGKKNVATWVIVDILRQKSKSFDAQKRRELSDSLVARAIALPGPNEPPLTPRHALEPFIFAGMAASTFGGTPDPDALDRLVTIHRSARLIDVRIMAIGALEQQVDPARALPYLKTVALSPTDGTRHTALAQVLGLAQNASVTATTRDQAAAVLRELYDSKRIADGELCRFAAEHGWPPRSDGRRCSID